MKYSPAALLLAIFIISSCGQKPSENAKSLNIDSINQVKEQNDSTRKGVVVATNLTPVRDRADMNYAARIGDHIYYCSSKGIVERTDTVGSDRQKLFDLKVHFIIDKVYLLPLTENDYIISWQETTYLGLNSYVMRFSANNSRPSWSINYKAPDPGIPVVSNGCVYLSTLGIISKVNLESGQHEWLHDSLYETTSLKYKRFDMPRLYNHTVVFFDFPIQGRKGKRDSIWVDDRTGKLIR